MGAFEFSTAILIVFSGGDPFEKGSPPDPHPKTFNNLGQSVDDYDNVKIILLLVVRNYRDAPPNGTLLPNRRLVSTWLFETIAICFFTLLLIQLIV